MKNILKRIKRFFEILGEIAQLQQDMETGHVSCLKCSKTSVDMIYRGIDLVGICRNCGYNN